VELGTVALLVAPTEVEPEEVEPEEVDRDEAGEVVALDDEVPDAGVVVDDVVLALETAAPGMASATTAPTTAVAPTATRATVRDVRRTRRAAAARRPGL